MPTAIENRSIEDLILDPENARKHGERDVEAIATSLKQFGQQSPIVIDRDGTIVKGNGTALAAMKLGWTHIECIQTSLSGQELRAYAIADNRTAELSGWDYEKLAEQLTAFESEALTAATAFNRDEIDEILAKSALPIDPDSLDEVDPIALPSKAKASAGAIYAIGDHRVACGDCRDSDLRKSEAGPQEVAASGGNGCMSDNFAGSRTTQDRILARRGYKIGAIDDIEPTECEQCGRKIRGRKAWWKVSPNNGDPTEPVAYCRPCAMMRAFTAGGSSAGN